MKNGLPLFLLTVIVAIFNELAAQPVTKSALFIGNSYIYTNDLPAEIRNIATSMGDELITDSNTPGGYTFELHSTNATTLSKIALGSWDYVVLQEQSQIPSFPIGEVETICFPFASILNDLIHDANACTQTMFFMTWGRKEGDAANCPIWPPVCTYNGMDSLLNLRYRMMAEDNAAQLAPVGQVWHYLRDVHPEIELYNPDFSHPSVNGSYAAAVTFYTAMFLKNPESITYNGVITPENAAAIRSAVKETVYDSLYIWNLAPTPPVAQFTYAFTGPTSIDFVNLSENADTYFWEFGDGTNSTEINPSHIFPAPGWYITSLSASDCFDTDVVTYTVDVGVVGGIHNSSDIAQLQLYPNPVTNGEMNFALANKSFTTYTISNINGQLVSTGNINPIDATIPVDFLPDGLYLFSIANNNGDTIVQNFIVAPH